MGVVFLTLLSAGYLGVLALCRMDEVAWRFVRLITVLSLSALSVGMAGYVAVSNGVTRSGLISAGLVLVAGVCAFAAMGLSPLSARLGGWIRGLSAGGGMLSLAAAARLAIELGVWSRHAPWATLAFVAYLAAAALLMGAVSLAMLLGHAYLTHTEMPMQPLRRLAALFATVMAIRVLLAIVSAAACWRRMDAQTFAQAVHQEWIVLIVRYGVGLLIPAVFCYMVWRTVRLRATQSATGILYFTLVLIYLGELAALQLTRELDLAF